MCKLQHALRKARQLICTQLHLALAAAVAAALRCRHAQHLCQAQPAVEINEAEPVWTERLSHRACELRQQLQERVDALAARLGPSPAEIAAPLDAWPAGSTCGTFDAHPTVRSW